MCNKTKNMLSSVIEIKVEDLDLSTQYTSQGKTSSCIFMSYLKMDALCAGIKLNIALSSTHKYNAQKKRVVL